LKQLKPKNCRYCNARLHDGGPQCPVCARHQRRWPELAALLLAALVVGLTIWLQVAEPFTREQATAEGATASQTTGPAPHTPVAAPLAASVKHTAPINKLASAPEPAPVPATEQAPKIMPFSSFLKRTSERTTATEPLPRPRAQPSNTRYQNTRFEQSRGDYPFYVAEKKWDPRKQAYDFYRVGMQGSERVIQHDLRRYFISENQSDYPEPEGGCGPTALLNLYVWYSKFGLIDESIKHSDPRAYKLLKFKQIDRIINHIQGHSRSRADGTNSVEQVIAIDELVRTASKEHTRIHFEYKQPPLSRSDFLNISRNYRAGILTVRPKDPTTGLLRGYHAVLVIRSDTSGKITIANWGDFSHGRIVNRQGKQWFVPDDAAQYELQVERLTTLIPFTPTS
tara:strand:+ start:1604 stop:2791 length:1188 start_codon:yes stop_codon:yes gene_type:complete